MERQRSVKVFFLLAKRIGQSREALYPLPSVKKAYAF
jgi:hypothetical protein